MAVYVFYKSACLHGDKKLMIAAYCLFFSGIVKCLLKPWEFNQVSINNLVGSSVLEDCGQLKSLDEFVKAAIEYFQANNGHGSYPPDANKQTLLEELCNLCVDITPPYSKQLNCMKYLGFHLGKAHDFVKSSLSMIFDRLYTKDAILMNEKDSYINIYDPNKRSSSANLWNILRFVSSCSALFSYIWFFFVIHKEAYNSNDVKITYNLMALTFLLDFCGGCCIGAMSLFSCMRMPTLWPDEVAQYNLIEYLARNQKHRYLRKLATLLVCNYIDQLWCMKPSRSSSDITRLVTVHIGAGWQQIHDVTTYRRFNDSRGQWTLERAGLLGSLVWSLRRPFDESVLLWHLATDFYLEYKETPPDHKVARCCREMSNYMVYLLFINPEMLIPGARRNLFRYAYKELKKIVLDEQFQEEDDKKLTITMTIVKRIMYREGSSIVLDAWAIAQERIRAVWWDEEKMLRVVQGVWVEMLCFSAGRCRGYLHAKNLGKGGEYLSYVWLLLSYMGMETLAERVQRIELQDEGLGAAATGSDDNV